MRIFVVRNLLGRKADLNEELESHLRMAVADRVARGESPEDARREAMREFGNVPLVADVTRERWGWLRMEQLRADVSFGWRQLWKRKVTTAAAVVISGAGDWELRGGVPAGGCVVSATDADRASGEIV